MNRFLISSVLLLLLASCTQKKQITHPADYAVFLSDDKRIEKELVKQNAEMKFWQNRLANNPGNYVDLLQIASLHSQKFKWTGDPAELITADSLYELCLSKVKDAEPEIYFSVSQNKVTQHRFRDAWTSLSTADSIGVNPYLLRLLRFDAAMELGYYQVAEKNIEEIKDKEGFDYLVRKAKLEDHNGRLDNAILLMEKALQKVRASGKKSLVLWSLSNLGDMYGHAGRIEQAYKNYLEVLKTDSSYLYALKGIAWIAYSHDNDTKEAKRILNYILSQTSMPDLYLLLAEMEKHDGNMAGSKDYVSEFLAVVTTNPAYGDMYNKYLITVYAEEMKDYEKAFAIAQEEVNNRPTPETHDWLAWVLFHKGEKEKAFEIVSNYVIGKTFEPDAQLHAAFILNAMGEKTKARELFKECLGSSFELGPVTTGEIKKEL
jgi:tetratricopeptide (TPR) repeat protein